MEQGEKKTVRELILDDDVLWSLVKDSINAGLAQMKELFRIMDIFRSIQISLQLTKADNNTDLYIAGLAGKLAESDAVRELLSRLKKISSDIFMTILGHIEEAGDVLSPLVNTKEFEEKLETLLEMHTPGKPLHSHHDNQSFGIETTVVKDKVNFTKKKKKISENDMAYTELLEQFVDEFESSLRAGLINPRGLFLHEVFIFDLRNPLRDTFAPRSRFCIERALSTPFDYLASSISSDDNGGNLSSSQPETAILYQLYLESGSLINVFDLWKAFSTIVCGDENGSDNRRNYDERTALMLFYQALAELKTLGMMKPSRKKIDHISKSAWKGL